MQDETKGREERKYEGRLVRSLSWTLGEIKFPSGPKKYWGKQYLQRPLALNTLPQPCQIAVKNEQVREGSS